MKILYDPETREAVAVGFSLGFDFCLAELLHDFFQCYGVILVAHLLAGQSNHGASLPDSSPALSLVPCCDVWEPEKALIVSFSIHQKKVLNEIFNYLKIRSICS